jgi:hypothetical protein
MVGCSRLDASHITALFLEDTRCAISADTNVSRFVDEAFEMFIRSEGGDALQSSPKGEPEVWFVNRDILQPNPKETPSSSLCVSTDPAPGDLSEPEEKSP